jgi:hypothetical protein
MTSDKALKLAFLLTATDSMSETLKAAGKNLTGFQQRITQIGANASRVGGLFMTMGNQIAGGMLNMVKDVSNYADSAFKDAQKVGMQVGEFQKLAYAADLADVSQEQLVSGMAKFSKTLTEASKGTGTAAQAFKDLGININGPNGALRAQQDILADVADVFARVGDSAEKTALSQVFFGKSGAQLIPMLNAGSKGLKELGEEAKAMGLAFDNQQDFEAFNDNLRRVDWAVLGLKSQISIALMPILDRFARMITSAVKALSSFAKEHQWLTKVIAWAVTALGSIMFVVGAASVTFGAIVLTFNKVVKAVKLVKTAIAATQTAMLFFKAVIHGTDRAMYSALLTKRQFTIATKLHTIVTKISTATQWAWNGAVTAGKAILAFFTSGVILSGIKIGILAAWQGLATAAQWLFNASLYACPLVWIIVAIMAVIAAVVLMVKYWDNIVDFFAGIWDGIKNIFSSIGEWFAGLWDGIKNVFSNAWNGILSWLASIPEKFVEFGRNIIQGLIKGITGAIKRLWETIKNVGKGIGKFFSKILGINSPSTVFAKYGMNITQGLVVGIDRGGGAVERATGGLAMQAVGSYGQSVQTVSAGGMGGSFNYSPTINIGAGVSEGTKQDFSALLRQHYRDIVGIMQRYSEDKMRISFN